MYILTTLPEYPRRLRSAEKPGEKRKHAGGRSGGGVGGVTGSSGRRKTSSAAAAGHHGTDGGSSSSSERPSTAGLAQHQHQHGAQFSAVLLDRDREIARLTELACLGPKQDTDDNRWNSVDSVDVQNIS